MVSIRMMIRASEESADELERAGRKKRRRRTRTSRDKTVAKGHKAMPCRNPERKGQINYVPRGPAEETGPRPNKCDEEWEGEKPDPSRVSRS